MINEDRKRKGENPGRRTNFLKGGELVDQSKLVRYKKRKQIATDDEISEMCKLY